MQIPSERKTDRALGEAKIEGFIVDAQARLNRIMNAKAIPTLNTHRV